MASSAGGASQDGQKGKHGDAMTNLMEVAAWELRKLQISCPDKTFTDKEKAAYISKLNFDLLKRQARPKRPNPSEVEAVGIGPSSAEVLKDVVDGNRPSKKARTGNHDFTSAQKVHIQVVQRLAGTHGAKTPNEEVLVDEPGFTGRFSGANLLPKDGIRRNIEARARIGANQNRDGHIFDMLSSLCSSNELILEICTYLRVKDIVNLYSISKVFHLTLDADLKNAMIVLAKGLAPTSAQIFDCRLYKRLCIRDPTGRLTGGEFAVQVLPDHPWQEKTPKPKIPPNQTPEVRFVPTLRWLQMVVSREREVRDILAALARQGLRHPPHAHVSLKKMWLLMDCSTNTLRNSLIRREKFFLDVDLITCQLFVIQLHKRFTDPVFDDGHGSDLMRVMLGQRDGLHVLWKLLRRKAFNKEPEEILRLKIRYDGKLNTGEVKDFLGVPRAEVGVGHLECWGLGTKHLDRPDELILREALRRDINMKRLAVPLFIFGHVDFKAGKLDVPEVQEMYMSDDELPPLPASDLNSRCGNVPLDPNDWQAKHAMKRHWRKLTKKERKMVKRADKQEKLRTFAFDAENDDYPIDDDMAGPPGEQTAEVHTVDYMLKVIKGLGYKGATDKNSVGQAYSQYMQSDWMAGTNPSGPGFGDDEHNSVMHSDSDDSELSDDSDESDDSLAGMPHYDFHTG